MVYRAITADARLAADDAASRAERTCRGPAAPGPGNDEAAGRPAARGAALAVRQCEQPFGAPPSSAVRKLEPQPQADTAFGLLTVKPAPISVST